MRTTWSPRRGDRRTARHRSLVVAVLCGLATLALLPALGLSSAAEPSGVVRPGAAEATETPGPDAPGLEDLEREKLRQEIRKLENENDRTSGVLGWMLAFAPFVTVLVAVGSLAGTLHRQSRDAAEARRLSEEEARRWRADFLAKQEAEAEARREEEYRRFDEQLTRVATSISSDNLRLQLNGAATLGLFIKDRYPELHCDLLNIVTANLKRTPGRTVDPAVADQLCVQLAKLLRFLFADGRPVDPSVGDRIDLTHMRLYGLDLHGLHLPEDVHLDLAFSEVRRGNLKDATIIRARGGRAVLDHTHFTDTVMREARFNGARAVDGPVAFHGTTLVSATFEDAVLPAAEFEKARMQGARFRRAVLCGARFEEADLADAYFEGAIFDEAALRSIALGAKRWRNAHFDPPIARELERISSEARTS